MTPRALPAPSYWMTHESVRRASHYGGNMKGTVPVHVEQSAQATIPLFTAAQMHEYAAAHATFKPEKLAMPEVKTIAQRVREIVAEDLGVSVDRCADEARFDEDLNADSLDKVEMAMTIEDAFGMQINDEQLEPVKTVGQLVKFVEERNAPR
jgi:acyl carrier protein